MTEESAINYRGRKAARARSEQRRRAILEAALRIVVSEGVRGVRHRAVAKEAGVPLSATTYYFDDISDLIADTFTLFAESAMNDVVDPIYQHIGDFVHQHKSALDTDPQMLDQLLERLTALITSLLQMELRDNPDEVAAADVGNVAIFGRRGRCDICAKGQRGKAEQAHGPQQR